MTDQTAHDVAEDLVQAIYRHTLIMARCTAAIVTATLTAAVHQTRSEYFESADIETFFRNYKLSDQDIKDLFAKPNNDKGKAKE